ncbi:MAG: hypothetical protein R3F61_29045 [Myxococcota bacterium]
MLVVLALAAHAADLHVGAGQAFSTIDDAIQASVNGDRLILWPGTYTLSRNVNHNVTLVGLGGPDLTVVRGSRPAGVIEIQGSRSVVLRDLTLDGQLQRRGLLAPGGSTVQMERCVVQNGVADDGGALALLGSSAILESVEVRNHSSPSDAGCIDVRGSVFVARGVTLEDCTSVADGGAMRLLLDNSATARVVGSDFRGNSGGSGGAIWLGSGRSLEVRNTTFVGNEASQQGGAVILASGASATLEGVLGRANTAGSHGGGLMAVSPVSLSVRGSLWEGNASHGYGGAVCASTAQAFEVSDSWFEGNHADWWAGAVCMEAAPASSALRRSMVCGNSTDGDGGGVDASYGSSVLSHTVFLENVAESGGAVWGTGYNDVYDHNLALDNTATAGPGAFAIGDANGQTAPVERNVFVGNAGVGPAVAYSDAYVPFANWYFDNPSGHATLLVDSDTTGIDPGVSHTWGVRCPWSPTPRCSRRTSARSRATTVRCCSRTSKTPTETATPRWSTATTTTRSCTSGRSSAATGSTPTVTGSTTPSIRMPSTWCGSRTWTATGSGGSAPDGSRVGASVWRPPPRTATTTTPP